MIVDKSSDYNSLDSGEDIIIGLVGVPDELAQKIFNAIGDSRTYGTNREIVLEIEDGRTDMLVANYKQAV